MSTLNTDLQKKCINTIRTLAIDSIQKANSGHPGMPMGCAPIAHLLYSKIMKHNPANPSWLNRDRFVLSAGHGSMLLYSALHLSGYALSLDELKNFRQWESKTPGHPEVNETPGVETTTGPLGQGVVNAVGMAMAASFMAEKFNREDAKIIDHFIYVIASDGEMMEGISHEASSLAGHLGLGKLIVFYDDNEISIEGSTSLTMSEDVARRYEAYGWHVQTVMDVNDLDVLETSVLKAQKDDRPSIIITKTHIGFGSPNKQDKASSHGSPLGAEEIKLTKENYGFPADKSFYIPEEVIEFYSSVKINGEKEYQDWTGLFKVYSDKYPSEAKLLKDVMEGNFGDEWIEKLPVFKPEDGSLATRSASGKIINAIAPSLPTMIGGSADLAPSNNTWINDGGDFCKQNYTGRNVHYGVREAAMAAIMNGMALYGGVLPYGGTFLVFADYMRSPIRMAALMKQQIIFILTHDSIGLGEDGPTHQPIEHIASLRAIPNLTVFRPADANETAYAWKYAVQHKGGPVALALTRQNLVTLDRSVYGAAEGTLNGAYILKDSEGDPDIIMISTGSEVEISLAAADKLLTEGINARVVSMPSWEVFEKQSSEYKDKVLPGNITKRLAIEAGIGMGWERYVGFGGDIISLERFGASAPAKTLFEKFGFTVENIVSKSKNLISK